MSHIAIYLDPRLLKTLDRTATLEGKSRSAWVKEAIEARLGSVAPASWFKVWGTWEDERSTEQILRDIDQGYQESPREPLK